MSEVFGGGIKPFLLWRNVFTRDTITPGAENTVDENTVDFWEGDELSASVSGEIVNAVGIQGHDLAGAAITVGADGAVIGTYTPEHDGLVLIIHDPIAVNTSYDVSFSRSGRVTNIMAGRGIEFPHGIDSGGFDLIQYSTRSELIQNNTLNGNYLGNRVVRQGLEIDIPLNFLDQDTMESVRGFIPHYNEGHMFFFAT